MTELNRPFLLFLLSSSRLLVASPPSLCFYFVFIFFLICFSVVDFRESEAKGNQRSSGLRFEEHVMEPSTLLFLTKMGTSLLIFIICLIGGLVPVRLASSGSGSGSGSVQTALSFGNCFGGGVLLGVSMVHLLVDSESGGEGGDSPSDSTSADPAMETAHRFPHLMAALGFLIAFILERVAFAHSHDHDLGNLSVEHETGARLLENDEGEIELSEMEHGHGHGHSHKKKKKDHDHDHDHEESQEQELHPHDDTVEEPESEEHEHEQESEADEQPLQHGHAHHAKKGHLHHAVHHEHGHGHGHKDEAPPLPYLLYSVLALESFVTGSALGIQEDQQKVTFTFFAIATHIWAEAFTLSINLLKSKFSLRKVSWLMVLFSAITPFSVLLGIAAEKVLSGSAVAAVSQTLVALAAGIFLYVAIIEIMVEEFHSQERKWQKLGLLLLGFVFVSAVGWI